MHGAYLRKLLPIVVEVLKTDGKNDHDAADIMCDEMHISPRVPARSVSPLNRPADPSPSLLN